MNNAAERIKNFLAAHREEIVSDLAELCRIPSVSQAGADGYPFGKNVNDALLCVKSIAARNGVECNVREDLGYATAHVANGEKTIGLFSHCDVVPVKDDEWIKTKPYEPYFENGYMFCRGSEDNKSAAVACIYIARMINEGVISPKSSYMCYFGGSEETGMQDMENYISHEKVPDICLVPDNGYPVCVGEKGIMRFSARPKKAFSDILTFDGGIAVNAVIGTHVATVRDRGGLFEELCAKTAENDDFAVQKNGDVITVTTYGKSSHAAMPEGSKNAAVMAARLLSECEKLCADDRAILAALVELSEDYYGSAVGIASDDEHFGKNTYVLGISECTDGKARFKYDIRYGMGISAEVMTDNIGKSFGKCGFDVEVDENNVCFVTGAERKYVDAVLKVYSECTGIASPKEYYSGGGTYARCLGNALGINIHDYSKVSLPEGGHGLPAGHGEAHQPDEQIFLDAYFAGVLTDCLMLLELDGLLSE